jgi:MFS family permease
MGDFQARDALSADASGLSPPGRCPMPYTDIPHRLDALPWSRWHWRVVLALGITWILDGLEVTMVGAIGPVLERPETLGLDAAQIGLSASAYIGGAVLGALYFGRLADRLGRKRLFLVTLTVYLIATLATAFSWSFASFIVFRFFTGVGIGGEYAAINSAIDELIPARVRGRVSLAINGSFWLGAAGGAALALVLLDERVLGAELGWRVAFGLGALMGIAILLVRRNLPESPRWLVTHGRAAEAEREMREIEAHVAREHGSPLAASGTVGVGLRPAPTLGEIMRVLVTRHRRRAVLGFTLMVAQAFFYNAIFFTYALVLTRFYGIPDHRVGLFIVPFAIGNFLGPLLLGPLFDRVGRRVMIAATYGLSGVALAITGYGFMQGWLDAVTQTLAWSLVFFLASAAASSAYLTVSEVFPLEMRALSIAVFYAIGTGVGGFLAPALFGALIETQSRTAVAGGYWLGAALVLIAAGVAWRLGVDAERKPLEAVATPLTGEDAAKP